MFYSWTQCRHLCDVFLKLCSRVAKQLSEIRVYFTVYKNKNSLRRKNKPTEIRSGSFDNIDSVVSGVKSILKLYLSKSIVTDGKTTRSKVESID